jgi:hypothetical protein
MENLTEDQIGQSGKEPNTPKSETAAASAGANSTDEDAANEQFAERETSKGFDRDQEELNLGLDDGDLDTDLPEDRN